MSDATRPTQIPERPDDAIRRLVLEGFYQPGERISDLKLAQKLGIGRMHVREAFQRLAKEGILIVIPRRGTFVTKLEPHMVMALLEVREAIEVQAARLAALRANPEEIAPLRELLAVSRMSLVHHGGIYPMDLDFHEAVVRLTRNEKLETMSRETNLLLRLARVRSTHSLKRWRESIDEHDEVLAAIEARDVQAADRVMRLHLAKSRAAMHPDLPADAANDAVEIVGV